jgi:hypothetical protein
MIGKMWINHIVYSISMCAVYTLSDLAAYSYHARIIHATKYSSRYRDKGHQGGTKD